MWYTYILFFALVVGIEASLSFILGRIVDIAAKETFDYTAYSEVPVFGDLTTEDMRDYHSFEKFKSQYDNSSVR